MKRYNFYIFASYCTFCDGTGMGQYPGNSCAYCKGTGHK